MNTARHSVYDQITQHIIDAINANPGQYKMPWHHLGHDVTRPINVVSKRRYHGINILLLWALADAHHYSKGQWATYRQWQEKNAQVRKGERGHHVVLWKTLEPKDVDPDAESQSRLYARTFTVFNVDQVDGYEPTTPSNTGYESDIQNAIDFLTLPNVRVEHGGDTACYSIASDLIRLPEFGQFKTPADYISTRAHETIHATGAASRLNRTFGTRFKDQHYAFEELIAELGAAMLMADLGLACIPRPDHAAYLANWLSILNDDPRAIFTAAAHAQKAVDWIHQQQPQSLALAA